MLLEFFKETQNTSYIYIAVSALPVLSLVLSSLPADASFYSVSLYKKNKKSCDIAKTKRFACYSIIKDNVL